jgi:hypothetical protein
MRKVVPYLVLAISLVAGGCSKSEEQEESKGTLETRTYSLHSVDKPEIQGSVKISELENGNSELLLKINGSSTDIHPAYIYSGGENGNGAIAITLEAIECDCEESITVISKLDNGTPITFQGLKAFNGHIKIHQSATELGTIIAQGNIGVNGN